MKTASYERESTPLETNSNRADEKQRIYTECPCGKRLAAKPQHAGKKVKCPACGKILNFPTSLPDSKINLQVDEAAEGMDRKSLIALWSSVAIVALICISYLVWHSYSSHQAKIVAANERISQAIETANEWLGGKSSLDAKTVEQSLFSSLKDQVATEKEDGEIMLIKVRERREQLAEQERIELAQREADSILNEAKQDIANKRITEAIGHLRNYVSKAHATDKKTAQKLLDEAETAVSDSQTIDILVAMKDQDFNLAKTTGDIRDDKVSHPVLMDVRIETVNRNLKKAAEQREKNKLAEKKRQEDERVAMMKRQKEEKLKREQEEAQRRLLEASKPLRVFLGGILSGNQAAYYRLQPTPSLMEVKKDNSASVFDKADQPKWESKYLIENVVIAPGALMSISVENYEDGAFGQHSEWSWNIAVAVPDGASLYQGMSFSNAIGEKVDRWNFSLVGTAQLEGMKIALYQFQEKWGPFPPLGVLHRPVDKILKRMTNESVIKYRLSTGPKGSGPVYDAELSEETSKAIFGLLRLAKYKNWMDKPEYEKEWMKQ